MEKIKTSVKKTRREKNLNKKPDKKKPTPVYIIWIVVVKGEGGRYGFQSKIIGRHLVPSLVQVSQIHVQSPKKNMTSRQRKQFFKPQNYSNITKNLCVCIIRIFTCFPPIFICFRQLFRHRFFFFLLVVCPINIGNPEIYNWRNFLCKGQTCFQCKLKLLQLIPESL